MSEQTELPWAYKSNGHYFDIGIDNENETLPIYPCAIIGVPHEQEANARLIVKAVNYHERLVEALKELELACSNVQEASGYGLATPQMIDARDILREIKGD